MLESILRMTADIVSTSVAAVATVAEPIVDVTVETVNAVDDYVVSPVADVVSDTCDSIKDSLY